MIGVWFLVSSLQNIKLAQNNFIIVMNQLMLIIISQLCWPWIFYVQAPVTGLHTSQQLASNNSDQLHTDKMYIHQNMSFTVDHFSLGCACSLLCALSNGIDHYSSFVLSQIWPFVADWALTTRNQSLTYNQLRPLQKVHVFSQTAFIQQNGNKKSVILLSIIYLRNMQVISPWVRRLARFWFCPSSICGSNKSENTKETQSDTEANKTCKTTLKCSICINILTFKISTVTVIELSLIVCY